MYLVSVDAKDRSENMKILRNLCLHFARQDGKDGKKRKENHATKVTKIWDERNNYLETHQVRIFSYKIFV